MEKYRIATALIPAPNADRINALGATSHAEATGENACVSRHVRFAYELLIVLGGSTHQSSWVGIASMDGSEDFLYRAHSSASANQYSNSLFASWARSRHIVSKAEKRFLESTRPLELILQDCNPLEGAGYLPFCNRPDSFVSVSTRNHLHGSDWPQPWPVRFCV